MYDKPKRCLTIKKMFNNPKRSLKFEESPIIQKVFNNPKTYLTIQKDVQWSKNIFIVKEDIWNSKRCSQFKKIINPKRWS